METGGTASAPTAKYENHFLRAMCAVFIMMVVIIHYNPRIPIGDYEVTDFIYGVGRFAMPIFFMISGYFTFSKDGHAENNLGRKLKRTLILILFIKVFYMILDALLWFGGYMPASYGLSDYIYGAVVFSDSSAHYWFVAVLFVVYLLHWICKKKNIDFKYLIPFGVAFIVVDMIIGEVLPLLGIREIFGCTCGDISAVTYVTIGLFFFQLGYYTHKYKEWTDEHWSTRNLLLVMIFGIALGLVEMFYLLSTHIFDNTAAAGPNLYFGTLIMVLPLFLLTFRLREDQARFRVLEWLDRNLEAWMYAFVAAGVMPLKLIYLAPYKDDLFIYQILGPALAIIWDIAMALIMFLVLTWIFKKKKAKKSAEQPAPAPQ